MGATILTVDDNEAGRYAVGRILERAGFEVKEAATGEQALELAKESPDAIILDVNLPDMSGFVVCSKLKANPQTQKIPVLILSAEYMNPDYQVTGLEAGAAVYLTQPVDASVLVAYITMLLRVRNAEEALESEKSRLEVSLRSIGDGVITTDLQGKVVAINRAAEELTGWMEREAVGTPVEQVFNIFNEKTRERCVNPVQRVIETGEIVGLSEDTVIIAPDAKERILQSRAAPIRDEAGNTYGVVLVFSDVTEKKKSEYALRESHRLLNATGRMARVGGWELDAESSSVNWTEEVYRIHEVPLSYRPPVEEAINFFHEDDRPRLVKAIQEALDHGRPYDLELRFITATGKQLWTRIIAEPEIVEGKTIRIRGIFQDITRRKLADEQLREHQDNLERLVSERTARLQEANTTLRQQIHERNAAEHKLLEEEVFANTTIDSLPGVFYVFDDQGVPLRWNENFERVTGYAPEEMSRLHVLDLFEGRDKDIVEKSFQRVLEEGQVTVEADFHSRNGAKSPYLFTGRRVVLKDKPCVIGMGIDITDLRRTEEALRQKSYDLKKRVNEMTCLYGVSRLVETSRSLDELLPGTVKLIPQGWQFPEIACALISVGDREFRSHTCSEPVYKQAEDIIVHGKRVGFIQVGYLEDKPVADEGPFVKEERNLIRAIAETLARTIERMEAETALQEHATALERANAELEQFAYISSHHLQEPLRKVINYSELLQRRYGERLDDRADKYIRYLVDGASRMRSLIEALLTYTSLDKAPLSRTATNFESLVQLVISDFDTLLENSEAVVTLDRLPTIEADASEMRQVLHHLVSNAVKFRGIEAPVIHVAAERRQDHWLFSVSDNGSGINPEFDQLIFGVFQRLHSPKRFPGTGMGLALCKKIVERHGGRIWVESEPGKGSTFFFTLPDELE